MTSGRLFVVCSPNLSRSWFHPPRLGEQTRMLGALETLFQERQGWNGGSGSGNDLLMGLMRQ